MHNRSTNERRRYRRHALHGVLSVELRVEVSGETPALLLTRGLAADISRGGVRCDIGFEIPVGTTVDVSFPDAPVGWQDLRHIRGRVARTVSPGGVPDQVAIAFNQPLDTLDLERLCAQELVASRQPTASPGSPAPWVKPPDAFTAC